MLNSTLLLIFITIFTTLDAANSTISVPNEGVIQQWTGIAHDSTKGLPIRIMNADLLLKHQWFDSAAAAYNSLLSDPTCKADLEWTLLAAEGLAECGGAYKEKALIILWRIMNNPSASDELKETAAEIINKAQSTVFSTDS